MSDRITRLYRFAQWCEDEAGDDDAQTAASLAFYEYLPRDPKVRGQTC